MESVSPSLKRHEPVVDVETHKVGQPRRFIKYVHTSKQTDGQPRLSCRRPRELLQHESRCAEVVSVAMPIPPFAGSLTPSDEAML